MRIATLVLLLGLLLPAGTARGQATQPAAPLAQAVERTSALTIYRSSFVIRARGTAADPRAAVPPAEEVRLVDFSATYNARDLALTFRSADAPARGYDPQQGLQLVVARGITYAAGPLPISGAAEARWYTIGRNPSAAVQPPLSPAVQLQLLAGVPDPARLQRVRFEQLDGRSCAVHRGTRNDAIAVLARLGRPIANEPGQSVEQQLAGAKITRAEYQAWVCTDGYVRQIRVGAAGTVGGRRALPFSLDAELRYSEIGSRALRIAPPRDTVVLRPFPPVSAETIAETPLLSAPSAGSTQLGVVAARETVRLLDRTADGGWYRVAGGAGLGWIGAGALPQSVGRFRLPSFTPGASSSAPPAATASGTPDATPAGTPAATPAGTPSATPRATATRAP